MKPIKELEPSLVANFSGPGALEKRDDNMGHCIRFPEVRPGNQLYFGYRDAEMKEEAEFEGITRVFFIRTIYSYL